MWMFSEIKKIDLDLDFNFNLAGAQQTRIKWKLAFRIWDSIGKWNTRLVFQVFHYDIQLFVMNHHEIYSLKKSKNNWQ